MIVVVDSITRKEAVELQHIEVEIKVLLATGVSFSCLRCLKISVAFTFCCTIFASTSEK